MRKHGRTVTNKQRWRCVACATTAIRRRHDIIKHSWRTRFIYWLTGTASLNKIARQIGYTARTIQQRFLPHWRVIPNSPRWTEPTSIIVLDGTSLVPRQCVVLIAYGYAPYPRISWLFTLRESAATWSTLLTRIPAPRFVVCDGQKGLLKAIATHWPSTNIQRCLIHIIRQSIAWITQHPQTKAGQQLLFIVRALASVRTRRQKRRWVRKFRRWYRHSQTFLNARTRHPRDPKRWWYTHRKLRRVRTLIERSLPHLFTFVRHPEVPRTSNHVEGGINARLHELFRAHRGISLIKKCVLTAYFLLSKLKKKATRNFY